MFDNLMAFLNALGKMLDTFVWIFCLLFIFLFSIAVCLVPLLGRGEALEGLDVDTADIIRVQRYFHDVGTGLFTLFQLTTCDNWDEIANPLIAINPWWRVFFVFFIGLASWTMMAVLTAEASDRMIEATSVKKENVLLNREKRHKEFIHFLRDAFLDADADGNGLLDKEEFQALMEKDFVTKQMKALGILLSQDELMKAWDMLDVDDSGELTIDEFVDGLGHLQEGLATKHIVNVDYSLKRVERQVEERLSGIQQAMTAVQDQNSVILDVIKTQEQSDSVHQPSLWLWQRWAASSREFESAMATLPQAIVPLPPLDPAVLRQYYDNSPHLVRRHDP